MAWVELAAQRTARSRRYRDAAAGLVRVCCTPARLHYAATVDGAVDTPVDFTPVRVNTAQFDGWRVAAADWTFGLGRRLTIDATDGWVGFGGRRGQNALWFRLVRVGYLHGPTRAWQDVGGAPTYARASLSSSAATLTIGPLGDQVATEALVTWTGIWTTPGGGDLTLRWRPTGDALKEEVVINQAAREWIAANRPPSTPASETYFGLVFQVDWSDVPKAVVQGVQQDTAAGDFSDDAGEVELRDASDRVLGALPLDYVRAGTLTTGGTSQVRRLRKRFYRDADGVTYLAVGVLASQLNGMQAGALVYDPTVNLQVGASADDGWAWSSGNQDTAGTLRFGSQFGGQYGFWGRFTGVTIPNAATITAATLTIVARSGGDTNACTVVVKATDQDNATAIVDQNDFASRAKTTASVNWTLSTTWTAGASHASPDLSTVVQAVVNRAGWSSGNALQMITDYSAVAGSRYADSYDNSTTNAAKLDVTYSAGGATEPVRLRRPLRVWRRARYA